MKTFLPVIVMLAQATSSSTQAQQNSPSVTPCSSLGQYTMTDGGPLQQIVRESDPGKRLVLLDNYVSQSKPKALLLYIYPLYFRSYNDIKNYPKAMEYADKFLALSDSPDMGLRYSALHEWAFAYSNLDSDDTTLAGQALARAREGIEILRRFEKPQCGDAGAFEAQKRLATTYFYALAGCAAMKLKDYAAAYDSLKDIVVVGAESWHPTPQPSVRP